LELAIATEEKMKIQDIVDKQEISPEAVDRMNADRDQLVKNLQAAETKTEEVNKIVWEKEIAIQKKMDEVC